jgi:hypothetical protein
MVINQVKWGELSFSSDGEKEKCYNKMFAGNVERIRLGELEMD